jgi:hypothetical protein
LLASVAEELATKHRDIWVRLLLRLETVSLRVECVARRMDTDKPLSTADFCEQRLLPLNAYGRVVISTGLEQISSRKKEECVVSSQVTCTAGADDRSYVSS